MDKDESHEISSEDKDVGRTAGEESPPSTDGESVDGISSSSFAASLREKVSIVRKERAGGVMKLLASGEAPSQGRPETAFVDAYMKDATAIDGRSGDGVEPVHGAATTTEAGAEANGAVCPNEEDEEDEHHQQKEPQPLPTCVECEDQHAELVCLSCEEPFCRPCWGSLHRQGQRAEHMTQAIVGEVMAAPTTALEPPTPPKPLAASLECPRKDEKEGVESFSGEVGGDTIEGEEDGGLEESLENGHKTNGKRRSKRKSSRGLAVGLDGSSVLDECRFIPLRLDERERGLLAMLKGALNVSEYTDQVDRYSRWGTTSKTINSELRRALAALSGMVAAGDRNWGQKNVALLAKLEENEDVFADIFEVGRRYKVTNPDKFRSVYGKMMYMLQDAQAQGRAGFNLVKDIQMVYNFVEEREGLSMLRDKRLVAATVDVSGISISKEEVREQVAAKTKARAELLQEYGSDIFSQKDMERVLDSIADANNYIAFNVAPVERMLGLLRKNFHPDKPEDEWSLKLVGGGRRRTPSSSMYKYGYSSGYGASSYGMSSMFGSSTAKLSHDHGTQYTFVTQSLRLWSEAMRNMYRLWYFADADLLSGKASYRLCNTGQGLHRVQSCPSVSLEMRRILGVVQADCGPWVGLSVVHLGDRDVPNALVFIDKYTQIPRILNPVAEAIRSLEGMALDPVLGHYVDVGWGGVHNAKMAILSDFFKGGFDGSGDDGGSCIDGRLTSAWNWCSLVAKKPFAPIFYLAGQYGFDGGWSSDLGD